MVNEIFPLRLSLNPVLIAGVGLWALALYLGFSPWSQWVIEQLNDWFNIAQRSGPTQEEPERIRLDREAQNGLWASILSIVPFLVLGGLCDYGVVVSLGQSWAISFGIIAVIGGGVYELGRRDGQSSR